MTDKTDVPGNKEVPSEAQARFTAIEFKKESSMVSSNAKKPEDDFQPYYVTETGSGVVIPPPYDPKTLKELVQTNNTLLQCIDAMEVNIDGTGFKIVKRGEDSLTEEDKKNIAVFNEFFSEPYPRESFIHQRRKLRKDLEDVGYAFLEVIRNAQDEIVFLRPIDADMMRIVRLDDPIPVTKTVYRNGTEQKINMMVRERRFAQVVQNKLLYFKEYDASRDLDKETGEWAPRGDRLPAAKRATEVIYFVNKQDKYGPYGVPRWINQTPSVIGSRQAEELNLEFFDSGGIPPIMLLISGGQLDDASRKKLELMLSGKAKNKQRAGVVEVQSTVGDLDSNSTARVVVERFGAEKQKDSMFEGYDDKCEKRVRSAFRLPPLFVGRSEDYTYASVYASYTLAEAQVFMPERIAFDEVINTTIMRELDPTGTYIFKSNALSAHDSTIQLKGLELSRGFVDTDSFVEAVNQITNLSLTVSETPVMGGPTPTVAGTSPITSAQKQELEKMYMDPVNVLDLVFEWVEVSGVNGHEADLDKLEQVKKKINNLDAYDRRLFGSLLAARTMSAVEEDPDGVTDLCEGAASIMGSMH